jgi:transcription initiation factor TFIIIB Brf1 subunit/transcription initiation factor TFIIB
MILTNKQREQIKKEYETSKRYGIITYLCKKFNTSYDVIKRILDEEYKEKQNNYINKKCRIKSEIRMKKIEECILNLIENHSDDELNIVVSKKIINKLKEKGFEFLISSIRLEHYAGAIYYLSCRKLKQAENLRTIKSNFNIDGKIKLLNNTIKRIKLVLGMKYCSDASIMGTGCLLVSKPNQFIEMLCSNLKLDSKKYLLLLEKVENKIQISPQGLAGGIVFVISKKDNLKITQREIADLLGITEVTVRNGINKIKELEK